MNLSRFLSTSSLAKRIKLPSRMVVHREALSPSDIINIAKKGSYAYEAAGQELCELEVNGVVIATGHIIRKSGKSYFKVLEMNRSSEESGKETAI